MQRALYRLALRVEDTGFKGNIHLHFHSDRLLVVRIQRFSNPSFSPEAVKKSAHGSTGSPRTDFTHEISGTWPFVLSFVEGQRPSFHSFPFPAFLPARLRGLSEQ